MWSSSLAQRSLGMRAPKIGLLDIDRRSIGLDSLAMVDPYMRNKGREKNSVYRSREHLAIDRIACLRRLKIVGAIGSRIT
jgi:hypothetical protein